MKNKIKLIILIAAIGVLGYSGYQLYIIHQQYEKGDMLYDEIKKQVFQVDEVEFLQQEDSSSQKQDKDSEDASTQKEEKLPDFSVDFNKLNEINEDIKGWLWIPNTEISYPLLQGEDNEEYLHKTYDNQTSILGSIFLDTRCSFKMDDLHTIIYGHNMKNGSMFGSLKQYGDEKFYKTHKYIYIFQKEKVLKYKVISAYTTSAASDAYQLEFTDNQQYIKYLEMIRKYASYETGTPLTEKNNIITLSTCTANENSRFVVHGQLLHTY